MVGDVENVPRFPEGKPPRAVCFANVAWSELDVHGRMSKQHKDDTEDGAISRRGGLEVGRTMEGVAACLPSRTSTGGQ